MLQYSADGHWLRNDAGKYTITDAFALKAVHKSISTVGLSYAGGGTSVGITYQGKAGTSAGGDNLIASGSMAMSPTITLTGSYNKDDALTTIGASGPRFSRNAKCCDDKHRFFIFDCFI